MILQMVAKGTWAVKVAEIKGGPIRISRKLNQTIRDHEG